jgi:hypothetical protein
MRKIIVTAVSTAVLALAAAVPALAGSPHFKHGGTPVCTVSSSGSASSTTCSASLTGLGNGDVTISVTVSGFAVYQCQNGGGNIAPGQNRVLEGPSTTPTTIPGSAVKNGNLTFTTNPAVLSAPDTVSGSAAGCPNSNWTGVNPVLTVTSIELAISQGGSTFYDQTVSSPSGLSGSVVFPA